MSETEDPKLGLPGGDMLPGQAQRKPFYQYEIPKDEVGLLWGDRDSNDLVFGLEEISTQDQINASVAGGTQNNQARISMEMLFKVICKIGDNFTNKNRDVISAWYDMLGPHGQRYVDKAFLSMVTVEEGRLETFQSARKLVQPS